ncbi:hypothetical protein Lser_V15G06983 [Lactuca serriola]
MTTTNTRKEGYLGPLEYTSYADCYKQKFCLKIWATLSRLVARSVHYYHHHLGPILQDSGFFLLYELGQERAYVSETLFTFVFLSFVLDHTAIITFCECLQ